MGQISFLINTVYCQQINSKINVMKSFEVFHFCDIAGWSKKVILNWEDQTEHYF